MGNTCFLKYVPKKNWTVHQSEMCITAILLSDLSFEDTFWQIDNHHVFAFFWDTGVVLLSVVEPGDTLFILALFGKGFLKHLDKFAEDVKVIAEHYNCDKVEWEIRNNALAGLYTKKLKVVTKSNTTQKVLIKDWRLLNGRQYKENCANN